MATAVDAILEQHFTLGERYGAAVFRGDAFRIQAYTYIARMNPVGQRGELSKVDYRYIPALCYF